MARYKVTVSGKGLQRRQLDKLVKGLEELKEGVTVTVVDDTPPTSRADRLSAALATVEEAAQEVESLKDELQEWYDNLPEAFQSGEKGEALESAISELEEIHDALSGVDGSSVEFPGMY